MTASPSDPLVPPPPTPPDAAAPAGDGTPRAPDSAPWGGWARGAAGLCRALGVVAVLAWRWARRSGRRTSPMAIAGIWLGAVSAVLGLVPTLLLSVLAERLEPEPPLTPAASARALDFEQRDLEEAAALAASRLIRLVDDESSDQRGSGIASTETYPLRLAVTTDGDVLLTTDGDVLAELPHDTHVVYQTWGDEEHFELRLSGALGGYVHVSDEVPTPTPAPPSAPEG